MLLAACTHSTCPPPVTSVGADDVPPPDEQLKRWQGIEVAVIDALKGGVPDAKIEPWLKRIAEPLAQPEPAQFDPALYAAQCNARNLLFTPIVQLAADPAISDDGKTTLVAIKQLLGA